MGTEVNITRKGGKGGKPSVHQTRVVVTSEGDVVEEKVTVNHGGEDMPQGGFRGGGQDIPTGHQSGYGGHADPKVPRTPKPPEPSKKDNPPVTEPELGEDKCCEHCFGLFERAGNYTVGVFKDGLAEGKKCRCGCDGDDGGGDDSHNRDDRSSKSGGSSKWLQFIPMLLFVAVIVWILLNHQGCNNLVTGKGEAEEPCCLEQYKEGEDRAIELMEKVISMNPPQPVIIQDDMDEDNDRSSGRTTASTDGASYGVYKPADADLTLAILAHLSGPDRHNFRKFNGDSLDGENKFVLMAAQTATLIASGLTVDYRGGEPQVRPAIYTAGNRLQSASVMAWQIGDRAKYSTSYQNPQSFYWWVNSAVQSVPASSATDFSEAVSETIDRLMERMRNDNINNINGIRFAHTSVTRKGRNAKNAPSSGGGFSSISMDYYHNPVPGSTWENKHWDGKSHAVDMMAPKGTPVYAASDGRVTDAGFGGKKSGKRVNIKDKYATVFYGHLDQIFVKAGQKVHKGQKIGTVGHTGSAKASAPHLHLEILRTHGGSKKNFPKPWMWWTQGKQQRT